MIEGDGCRLVKCASNNLRGAMWGEPWRNLIYTKTSWVWAFLYKLWITAALVALGTGAWVTFQSVCCNTVGVGRSYFFECGYERQASWSKHTVCHLQNNNWSKYPFTHSSVIYHQSFAHHTAQQQSRNWLMCMFLSTKCKIWINRAIGFVGIVIKHRQIREIAQDKWNTTK